MDERNGEQNDGGTGNKGGPEGVMGVDKSGDEERKDHA